MTMTRVDYVREYGKTYYERNRTEIRAKHRRYYLKHRAKCLEQSKKWYRDNKKYRQAVRRQWELHTYYNLTPLEFTKMFVHQDYACGICKEEITENAAHVDHNHKSGKVRGLLCGNCNRGLGCFKDSAKRLQQAFAYLELESP